MSIIENELRYHAVEDPHEVGENSKMAASREGPFLGSGS